MKRIFSFLACVAMLTVSAASASAHFGMVLPSEQIVMEKQNSAVTLDLKFWHPFENKGMNLDKPTSFSVIHDGKTKDLLPALQEKKEQGVSAWSAVYRVERPGLHAFVMQPQPYWEQEEDSFIIHYTKAYVAAFGDDSGWDVPLGLRTEIVPLTKPHALYAGNSFQGRVLLDGKPVPGAEVEVEWYPGPDARGVAPHDMMITQTVKADDAGIFTYTMPQAGWWGFAALNTAPEKRKRNGQDKSVELGAVLWLRTNPLFQTRPLK